MDHRVMSPGEVLACERHAIYAPDPDTIRHSAMSEFIAYFESIAGVDFIDYSSFHEYSAREFHLFWKYFLQWTKGLQWSGVDEPVCVGNNGETAAFFPNIQLNYAENLLSPSMADDDATALTSRYADGRRVTYTRAELRERVMRVAHALAEMGLEPGDRVVAVMRNDADAIIVALAVSALGATLSTCAPENGVRAILERFEPIAPRMMFAHTTPCSFDTGMSVASRVAAVADALPSLTDIIRLDETELPSTLRQRKHELRELAVRGDATRFEWKRFAFNHPLFIMFSSGTTGKPKCIVHGAGGTLIEHVKEHRLHSDFRAGDKLYFHTSCSWMMWNWQLSALASGVEIVTYDGPVSTVDTLWRLVAEERVTVFGTSPAYLKMCEEAGLDPRGAFDLSALRAMMSTGAVLYDSQYEWVREHVKTLPLQSISGGTDIIGCFVLGNPNLPVYIGEAQCKSLGLDVQTFDSNGSTAEKGELVCVNPFPSRPLGFFGDDDGTRFHRAYFSQHKDVWTHGDIIEFSADGAARLHGRSDGMLNVRGMKVSPSEIYRILSGVPEIRQAMVVQQNAQADDDASIVLLLVLRPGVQSNSALLARIRRELREHGSAALVPDIVAHVNALPVTHNGKPSETAARDAVNGIVSGNRASLANPECLDEIRAHPVFTHDAGDMPLPGHSAESIEVYLRALWERLFHIAPIDRDDDFFELGGHSLLAARMLADVRRATGRALPIATLIVAPTLARLAAVIASGEAADAASPTLVQMRAGQGRPVFMIHSITGSVMECLTLAGTLRSERPVYGVQARGLDGEETPQHHVEDMARDYVRSIRALQPDGPYALVGFSFGGLIAFEIAQQLLAAGESIEMLCLLDTYVHEHCLPIAAWTRHTGSVIADRMRELRALAGRDKLKYVGGKTRAIADHVRLRLGRRPLKEAPDAAGLPPALMRVRESMRIAMTTYKPRSYRGGPILFVRASINQEHRGDPMPLWRRVAKRGLHVTSVEGSHNDLVIEPQLQVVADTLARTLSRI